jgi:SpoVK/Ycf46/Vps4 family AAA+-type ATPase
LNAVQRKYPQIYSSTDKLLVDPKTINVIARDFMIATESITLVDCADLEKLFLRLNDRRHLELHLCQKQSSHFLN